MASFLDVFRQTEHTVRRWSPTWDLERMVQACRTSYDLVLRSWPWSFMLARTRYTTTPPAPVNLTLTQDSAGFVVNSGTITLAKKPLLLAKGTGFKPYRITAATTLEAPWVLPTGAYDLTVGYPFFDSPNPVVRAVFAGQTGPLQKRSYQWAESMDPFRAQTGAPVAYLQRSTEIEVWPIPDGRYSLDMLGTDNAPIEITPATPIHDLLVSLVVLLSSSHLLAEDKPELAVYYKTLYAEALQDAKGRDYAAGSWPREILEAEIGPSPFGDFPFPSVIETTLVPPWV